MKTSEAQKFRQWYATGGPGVWLTAASVSVSLILVFGLLGLIAVRGLAHFWPADLVEFEVNEGGEAATFVLGEIVDHEVVSTAAISASDVAGKAGTDSVERYLIKVGNRDISGLDFRWIAAPDIVSQSRPLEAFVAEREEWGNLYAYLIEVRVGAQTVARGAEAWDEFQRRLARKSDIREAIDHIEKDQIGKINYAMERLRLSKRRLELDRVTDLNAYTALAQQRSTLEVRYQALNIELAERYVAMRRDSILVRTAAGEKVVVPLATIVRAIRTNEMGYPAKVKHYFVKLWEFVSTAPREANTEGGVFPAIFGTVLMVIVMSILVTPFGVIAAIYLREYAKQNLVTRTIRIAVNNLAGVPSVVYGVFGLGFFVYFAGGAIDRLFYAEALPAPTFGTPGLLWSSLTLALLTVPVVIVATEEGLARIPRAIREGSLALGATKAETLWRMVLPMAMPAMITGLILAVARAAGEVAPLMMVGVVKLAPSLALDGNYPYLHVDRQFMHLGFHIYDVGFQSPNVEAARPLVFATALLLVVIIVVLNLAAIRIRNNLREKYNVAES